MDVSLSLATLSVFHNPPRALTALARVIENGDIPSYAELFRELIADNADADLTTLVERYARTADNVFTLACARGSAVAARIGAAAERDLAILAAIGTIAPVRLKNAMIAVRPDCAELIRSLPDYAVHKTDLSADSMKSYCRANGVGIFTRAKGFVYTKNGLSPVTAPDPIRLADLKGYEYQRREILDNTVSFLEGKPAQNVLLYGDRGTGKSSTVKALLNEYGCRGLRVVELNKSALDALDGLIETLHRYPMKFIVFIDDLSFNEGDDRFGLLKAALEGSLVTRPDNVVIYATSNRRHLLRETFSAREGNEIHRADTVDESLSLSDRFGLTVTFLKPCKDDYNEIVKRIAADYGVEDTPDLLVGAEQWAMMSGGRSPRVARQYIASLVAKKG